MQLPEYAYHLAEAVNWPAIQEDGLLPAETLIRDAFPAEPDRLALIGAQRAQHTILPTGVQIRDQKPMPAKALASCLVGLTPSEWYALINAHVFFWFDLDRVNRQRAACGARPQVVAVVRTAQLLEHFAEIIFLTPFNVGYALRKPALRAEATLVPHKMWSSSGWRTEARATGCKTRSHSQRPAELLVRGPIPRFERFVEAVVKLPPGQSLAMPPYLAAAGGLAPALAKKDASFSSSSREPVQLRDPAHSTHDKIAALTTGR